MKPYGLVNGCISYLVNFLYLPDIKWSKVFFIDYILTDYSSEDEDSYQVANYGKNISEKKKKEDLLWNELHGDEAKRNKNRQKKERKKLSIPLW